MTVSVAETEITLEPILLMVLDKDMRLIEIEGSAAPYADRRYMERFARGAVFIARALRALISQYLWNVDRVSITMDLGETEFRIEEGSRGVAISIHSKNIN